MKIKLVEAQFYSNIQKEVEKEIIPLLTDLGFNIQWERSVYLNRYEGVYKGIYTGFSGKKVPFSIGVNTTGKGIDEEMKQDAFMYIIFGGHRYDIGGFNSSDPEEVLNLINYAIPDLSEKDYTKVNEIVPNNDDRKDANEELTYGNKTMTRKKWYEEIIKHTKEGRVSFLQSAPLEIDEAIQDEIIKSTYQALPNPNIRVIKACEKLIKELK